MQRKKPDKITKQAINPLKQWATSTEEFLEEVGGETEETTGLMKDAIH